MFSPLPGSYCAVSPVHRGLIAGLECAEPEAGSVSSTNPSSTAVRWRIRDRKSTRLNSSHLVSTYAAFCLKKKNKIVGSRTASVPTHVTDTSTPIPSRVRVLRYRRTPSDPEKVIDITGGSLTVARKMAEVEFTKTGINYSFQIQCFFYSYHLVGLDLHSFPTRRSSD